MAFIGSQLHIRNRSFAAPTCSQSCSQAGRNSWKSVEWSRDVFLATAAKVAECGRQRKGPPPFRKQQVLDPASQRLCGRSTALSDRAPTREYMVIASWSTTWVQRRHRPQRGTRVAIPCAREGRAARRRGKCETRAACHRARWWPTGASGRPAAPGRFCRANRRKGGPIGTTDNAISVAARRLPVAWPG